MMLKLVVLLTLGALASAKRRDLMKLLIALVVVLVAAAAASEYEDFYVNNDLNDVSRIRVNFHVEMEDLLNAQAAFEMRVSYAYQSMHHYFARDDVALPGLAKYFEDTAVEEKGHADQIYAYINKRGGMAQFVDIRAPENTVWGSPLNAVLKALQLEKEVLASFLNIHSKAQARNDPHLIDFVETVFLTEQYDAMEELSTMATKFERAGTGLGEYIVDKNLQ